MYKIFCFFIFFIFLSGIHSYAQGDPVADLKKIKIVKTKKEFSHSYNVLIKGTKSYKEKQDKNLLVQLIKGFDKLSHYDTSYYLYEPFIELFVKNEKSITKIIKETLDKKRAKTMLDSLKISKDEFISGNDPVKN